MNHTRCTAVLLALVLCALPLAAQTTGALSGTVTREGTPLPGTTVTISSPNLLGTRTTVTDRNGSYNFGALPPGRYTVRFELDGMAPLTKTVDLLVSTSSRADAELQLTGIAESITVTASTPAILENTEVQTNFSARTIEDLPTGRTLIATVNMAPGVNQNGPNGATTISGGFAFDSTYYIDGAVVNEVLRGQPRNLFIEDAIQETTIQTGAISAEFGRFTGGVVTAVTKSGGNEFSGSLRDSLLNARWTAQGALLEPRPKDEITHTYEATLGGRILRDRLWFFGAGRYYDFTTQANYGTVFLPGSNTRETPVQYDRGSEETRKEIKLTGQLTDRHSLTGTLLDVDLTERNTRFQTPLEAKALDTERELPNEYYTLSYNGVWASNLLIEGLYARQDFAFVGSGADAPAPPERGTNIRFTNGPNSSSYAGYPTFCSGCSFPEERDNYNAKLKATYFLSTPRGGTHNLTAGYENFEDRLRSDNHQSGSDFTVWVLSSSLTGAGANRGPERVNGELRGNMKPGAGFIIWYPILESSRGNAFNAQSVFLNDKWDLSTRWSFNLGLRYDQNKGEDSSGRAVADDDNISPRLGATFDVFGDGRLRLNGSYSTYASKIANGNVGDAASSAGSPSYLYWYYGGPEITNATTDEMLDQIFTWFRSVGFTDNRSFFLGGGAAGIQTQIGDRLQTPAMDEATVGASFAFGRGGFFRADYQHRTWKNFYTNRVDQSTGKILDPLAGSDVDVNVVENSDDFVREYDAVLLQAGYRAFNRLTLGGNYTWSKLRGNIEGETSGSGPVVTSGPDSYPEFTNFSRNGLLEGYLAQDQRHKVRLWAGYDLPTPIGNFNVSLLQRYDSGVPYSAAASVNPQRGTSNPNGVDPKLGGYVTAPTSVTYYFSDRGQFRTDNLTQTDLALNYRLPLGRTELFVQGDVLNAFNDQGSAVVNTTVSVLRNFNPFTETPNECAQGLTASACAAQFPTGGLWQKGPSFGQPVNATTGESLLPGGAAGDYQLPRTYRVSLGLKF